MRTVSYKCDRCGKPMTGRSAVKITAMLQRGMEPAEKSAHDFCQKCFVKVKNAFMQSLSDIDTPNAEPAAEPAGDAAKELAKELAMGLTRKSAAGKEDQGKKYHSRAVGPAVKEGHNVHFTVETLVPKKQEQPENEDIPAEQPDEKLSTERTDGILILGPLSKEEHEEILRLHVEEGLDADAIASRMRRLPKGVKRCINSAVKSGKLDELRAEFAARQKPVPEAIEDDDEASEQNAGSGASNAGIMKDAYTAPPQTEVFEGRRYDIGGILALANAGWEPKLIAEERHYDEDVVRMFLEKYL